MNTVAIFMHTKIHQTRINIKIKTFKESEVQSIQLQHENKIAVLYSTVKSFCISVDHEEMWGSWGLLKIN